MELHQNELTLVYDPKSATGRKIRPMAYSITRNVNEIDYTRTRLTTTLWKEIVQMLGNDPKSLLNKSSAEYKLKVKGNDYTMHGYMNILLNSPHLLRAPIAITRGRAILCEQPNDLLKLGKTTHSASKIPPHLVRRSV